MADKKGPTDLEALCLLRSYAAARKDGRFIGRTWMVALRLEVPTAKARTIMNRLAKRGHVMRELQRDVFRLNWKRVMNWNSSRPSRLRSAVVICVALFASRAPKAGILARARSWIPSLSPSKQKRRWRMGRARS